MAKIYFTKVVGTGNDFVILDRRDTGSAASRVDLAGFAKDVCRHKYSIGADGVLALEKSKKADLRMRVINPDGSEVSMCGNGARAAALYAVTNKWCAPKLTMETGAGIVNAEVKGTRVKIQLTEPKGLDLGKDIVLDKKIFTVYFVDTGVPHVVYFVENIDDYPVKEMGAVIRHHDAFKPGGTNVNFVKAVDDSTIRVRTYERGVEDETLACGTGATASAIISHFINKTGVPVTVRTSSGEALKIYFKAEDKTVTDVYLEGEANIVFEGGIDHV
jgi:diaminopimelate epimerase